MSRLRLIVTLAVAATVVIPIGSSASDTGGGCGQGPEPASLSVAECKFLFRGSLRISATAEDPEANRALTLRVWVHEYTVDHQRAGDTLGHETTLIVECSSSGRGYIACAEDWPTSDTIDLIHPALTQTEHLSCHVEADIIGSATRPNVTYTCVSGVGT